MLLLLLEGSLWCGPWCELGVVAGTCRPVLLLSCCRRCCQCCSSCWCCACCSSDLKACCCSCCCCICCCCRSAVDLSRSASRSSDASWRAVSRADTPSVCNDDIPAPLSPRNKPESGELLLRLLRLSCPPPVAAATEAAGKTEPALLLLLLLVCCVACDNGVAAGGRLKPRGKTALNAAGGCVYWWGLTGALPAWLPPLLPPPLLPAAAAATVPAAASRLLRLLLL